MNPRKKTTKETAGRSQITKRRKETNHYAVRSKKILKTKPVSVLLPADTLYYMLAQHLRGFEDCNAAKISRHFIDTRGDVRYEGDEIRVTFPRQAHNPVLRAVRWDQLPAQISWLDNARLTFAWR